MKRSQDLATLQQIMTDALLTTNTDNVKAAELLNGTSGLSAEQRLSIYRDSIQVMLTNTLKEIYPVCCRLVGDEFFTHMAEYFIRQHPSVSPDLNDYGVAFAEFAKSFPPLSSLVYYSDVAKVEWAWQQIYNGADTPAFDTQALAAIAEADQRNVVFCLPVAAVLLQSAYPIDRIWQVNQEDYVGDASVDLNEGAVNLMLWRDNVTMHMDRLSGVEWLVLNAVDKQLPFGELCEILLAQESSIDMISLLPVLVQKGWVRNHHGIR